MNLRELRQKWASGAYITNRKLTKKSRSKAAKKGWLNRKKKTTN